jgi:hypothetical protein
LLVVGFGRDSISIPHTRTGKIHPFGVSRAFV